MVTGLGFLGGGGEINIIVRATDKFSKTLKSASNSLKEISRGAIIIGGAVAVGLGLAVKTAIDFERAFIGVRKTVDLTESQFKDLENRFKTLSTEIPVSFVELSRIGELAGQLGVEGVENLEKFTETIAALAVTTNLTSEEAATSFARIANIMQEPIANVDKMGSVVVDLGNNFATTEREIVTFATRIAAAGKISGISTENIFAIATAFTSVGVQAEAGGTAVAMVLQAMNKAILESGDKLELLEKVAGLSVGEFEELFRRDAIAAFELFVKGLGDAGSESALILDELELGNSRLIRAFQSLAQAGGLLGDTIEISNVAFRENTALVNEAEKFYSALGSQVEIAKNKLLLLAEEIGNVVAPHLRDVLIPAIDAVTEGWKKLNPVQQDIIITFGEVTAIVGGAALALRGIVFVGSRFIPILGIIVASVTLVITAIKNWETIQKLFIVSMNIFKNEIFAVWNSIVKIIESSINLIISSINKLLGKMQSIVGGNIFREFQKVDFGGIKGTVTNIAELREDILGLTPTEVVELTTIPAQRLPPIIIEIDGVEIARALETEFTTQTST